MRNALAVALVVAAARGLAQDPRPLADAGLPFGRADGGAVNGGDARDGGEVSASLPSATAPRSSWSRPTTRAGARCRRASASRRAA